LAPGPGTKAMGFWPGPAPREMARAALMFAVVHPLCARGVSRPPARWPQYPRVVLPNWVMSASASSRASSSVNTGTGETGRPITDSPRAGERVDALAPLRHRGSSLLSLDGRYVVAVIHDVPIRFIATRSTATTRSPARSAHRQMHVTTSTGRVDLGDWRDARIPRDREHARLEPLPQWLFGVVCARQACNRGRAWLRTGLATFIADEETFERRSCAKGALEEADQFGAVAAVSAVSVNASGVPLPSTGVGASTRLCPDRPGRLGGPLLAACGCRPRPPATTRSHPAPTAASATPRAVRPRTGLLPLLQPPPTR